MGTPANIEIYKILKKAGQLPQKPALGRGMPRDVLPGEWDGKTTKDMQDAEIAAWDAVDQGRMGHSRGPKPKKGFRD